VAKEYNSSKNWEQFSKSPCLMFKMDVDGRLAVKGVTTVSFNIDKISEFLKKEDSMPKMNSNVIETRLL
jgi:hypothetical protein